MKEKIILSISLFAVLLIGTLSFDFIPIAEGYGGGGGGSGSTLDPRVCGEKLCSEIPGGRDAWESRNVSDTKVSYEENNYVASPKKQMKNGVASDDVVCKSGFTLMIRISGDAACVTPTTAEKLTNIGWGTIEKEFSLDSEIAEIVSTNEEESENIGRDLSVELTETVGIKSP